MGERSYYNEFDPYAAQWLRNLIAAGHIAPGEVDERSIVDVQPDDLRGFTQCHFFAGIGGWSLALRLAGWPDDRPVWTGSCPCQPFSSAGKQLGTADPRHLWPEFRRLIAECRPAIVFGEQVASRAGREWLAGVFADVEALAYAGAGADLCAAGEGAPHIRQRLYWVADANLPDEHERASSREQSLRDERDAGGERVGNTDSPAQERFRPLGVSLEPEQEAGRSRHAIAWAQSEAIRCADGKTRRIESGVQPLAHGIPARMGRLRGYGNAIVPQVAATFITATTGA